MMQSWRYTLRQWLADWCYFLLAPFRALRALHPANMFAEARFGGYQLLTIFGDLYRLCRNVVLGTFFFILNLPRNIYRALVFTPRWAWGFVTSAPPRLLLWTAVVGVSVLGASGATAFYLWREHRLEFGRSLLYRQLDFYMNSCEIEHVEEMLVKLRELAPDDPTIAMRLEAVQAREAPLGDPKLIRVIMRTHYRNGDYEKAAREAAKLIETFPTDWEARCMLADEASRRGDKESVQKHLSVLPKAVDVPSSIPPWVAWYAANLFQRLGDTARYDDILDFMVQNVLPILRSKEVVLLEEDAKLLLLDCYRLTLTQIDKRDRLVKFWEPAQRACASILESDKANTRQLLMLAQVQQLHLQFLGDFLKRGLITAESYKASAADIEERLRQAAERVIAQDPKSAFAYIALAEHLFRSNQSAAAIDKINEGIRACGPVQDLIADKALLLRRTDPTQSLDYLDRVVKIADLDLSMCAIYAEVAWSANRLDKVIEACRHAEKLQPGIVWAHRTEAKACMRLGQPTEAAAALQPVKSFLATDSEACELYVRAMCECKSAVLAEEFLQSIETEKRRPDVLIGAAHGFLMEERYAEAVRWSKAALERDPLNPSALWIVAEGSRTLAEQDDGSWDRDKVREALRAYRAVLRQQENNLVVVNNIVWLELKALESPKQAYESAAPLLAVQNSVTLPAEFLDTLGELYLAVGQPENARKVIDEAIKTAGARPAFLIHLALAHRALKQPEMAERYLLRAAEMKKTRRENLELVAAARLLQQPS